MFGDHRFLIGVADQHAHGIPRAANFRAIGGIGIRGQIDAKKAKPRADARTQLIGVFANAGGEDQRINAANGSGECADFTAHAKGKVIQGGFGGLGGGGTADTGDYGIVLQVGTTIVKGKLHVENKGAMGGGSPFGPQNDDERR